MSAGVGAWRAEVTLRVGVQTSGPLLLPTDEPVTFGRAEGSGLLADHPAASRTLARFVPVADGWILENGKRTRLLATSIFALDARFGPGARVLLQPADWKLTWDLDVRCEMKVSIRPDSVYGERLRVARDSVGRGPAKAASWLEARTDVAAENVDLTPLQRRRLGALFAYLIEGEPKPANLLAAAAERTGDTVVQITGSWVKVLEKINRQRVVELRGLEDLGYHLVEVAGVLGPDDVPPRPSQ